MSPLASDVRKYLEECLESMWNQDSEYSETRRQVFLAWEYQNAIRKHNGIQLLSEDDFEAACNDKGPKKP